MSNNSLVRFDKCCSKEDFTEYSLCDTPYNKSFIIFFLSKPVISQSFLLSRIRSLIQRRERRPCLWCVWLQSISFPCSIFLLVKSRLCQVDQMPACITILIRSLWHPYFATLTSWRFPNLRHHTFYLIWSRFKNNELMAPPFHQLCLMLKYCFLSLATPQLS